ncbi:MAG TPA: IS1595 family transposase [Stellaceae bacterium]|nr:IS1595 family transposase [Stellaceae bacterium]
MAQGIAMSGFLEFIDGYRDEAACIAALAQLRWPAGFVCAGCAGPTAYRLASRPRVFECAGCERQHSATAGTVFHRTRTPLHKWFAAAWLMAQDKRGVRRCSWRASWGCAPTRPGCWRTSCATLSERPEYPLDGLLEIDESYYGGRGVGLLTHSSYTTRRDTTRGVLRVESRPFGIGLRAKPRARSLADQPRARGNTLTPSFPAPPDPPAIAAAILPATVAQPPSPDRSVPP